MDLKIGYLMAASATRRILVVLVLRLFRGLEADIIGSSTSSTASSLIDFINIFREEVRRDREY